jgi:hypothetical protein
VKELKTRIERRLFGNRYWFPVFCDPSSYAVSQTQFQAVYNFRMWILRGSQDEIIAFEHINQTGIAFHKSGSKLDHASQHFVEAVRRCQASANFVQQVNM